MAPLSMYEEKNTGTNLPAQIELYADAAATSTSFLFITKGGGSANKTFLFQETRGAPRPRDRCCAFLDAEDPHARHRRLPALPPRDRDRRHLGRVHAEDREARELPLPRRRCRRTGNAARPRLPRPRARGAGAEAHAADGHRRAVRRQVLLPRRARDPPAAPRRLAARSASACRARPTARRRARSRATASSSSSSRRTRRSTCPRSTEQELAGEVVRDRPAPADGRDPRHALAATRSRRASRSRGPMIVARDIAHAKLQRAHRPRRGPAAVREGPPDLLRRARRRRPTGIRVGLLRPDHRRPHGLLRRPVHGSTAAASSRSRRATARRP